MARPMKPLVRGNGFYPSKFWIPFVRGNGLTNGEGGEPVPEIVWKKVSGTSPLSLPGAIANSIKSLAQYGLCTQASTPTPSAPVDIVCNNGALKYGVLGKNWFDDAATRRLEELEDLGLSTRWGETIDVLAGTYTVAWTQEADGSLYIRVFDGGEWGEYQSISQSGRTVTLTEDGIILVYCGSASNRQDNLLDHKIQVEVGSTATAYEPYKGKGIYTDGTPEVLTVKDNLFTDEGKTDGYYLANDGTPTSNNSAFYTDYIPVKPSHKYQLDWTRPADGVYTRVHLYGPSKNWLSMAFKESTFYIGANTADFDTTAETAFVRLSFLSGTRNIGLASELQTVTDIPMLLSVGDYADEGEIISGLLTHKVGIKVLDGTEAWSKSPSWPGTYMLARDDAKSSSGGICTHFVFGIQPSLNGVFAIGTWYNFRVDTIETLADWKAYLAAQYAAGTPVIVLYPLATPTTDSVTAQPLHTAEGDNTLSVTAEVSPVQLECEYANGIEGG